MFTIIKLNYRGVVIVALVVMEYTKGKLEGLSKTNGLSELNALMDSCNLFKCESGSTLSVEELKACLEIVEKKLPHSRYRFIPRCCF